MAEDQKVSENFLITEVMFDPLGSNTQHAKWIEIYNAGEDYIFTGSKYQSLYKINNFYVCDSISSTTNKCTKHSLYMRDQSLIFKKGEYLIIATNIEQFENDHIGASVPIFKSALGITATEKAFVRFCISEDANCGKSVEYGTFKIDMEEGHSLEKIKINLDNEKANWQQCAEIGGTPGKQNSTGFSSRNSVLSEISGIEIEMDEDIYENMYAYFEVRKKDNEKIIWSFGDGHRSYLFKTKHKFEKAGTYAASVRVYSESSSVTKNFKIDVNSFPHPKISITEINANPDGSDSGEESIIITNKSNKKINLKNWSIATGWKKFINHPIKKDVIIKKKKSKKITSNVSSFTLNNTKAKIQLRYPDGKVAHEVKYKSKDKTIEDDLRYVKVKGGWEWVEAKQDTKIKKQNSNKIQTSIIKKIEELNADSAVISPSADEVGNQPLDANENEVEKVNEEVKIEFKNKLILLSDNNVKFELLKSSMNIASFEKIHEVENKYVLIFQINEKDHYAVEFFSKLKLAVNNKISKSINVILK